MKRIILDQFERRWLMWTLFSLVSVTAGLVLGVERDIRISGAVFISFSIAPMDWGLGCPRVLLSLPFTARQIGRAYWWLTVCASTLLFAVFSAVGILIVGQAQTYGKFLGPWLQMFIATDSRDKFLGIWLETVLAAGLLCGSIFWLMSGAIWGAALSRAGEPWRKRFPRQFYACAFAIGLLGGIYFLCRSTINIRDKIVIAYLFGFVFSVLGWFRAKSLFVESIFRPDVARAGVARRKFEPRPGYGGVPYLIIGFCLFYLAAVSLLIASVIGLGNIMAWLTHRAAWSEVLPPALGEVQFWLFLICLFQTMIIGTHLKFLRSLPLTSNQLAATILCLAFLPVLIIGGPWILFVLMEPGVLSALSILKFCLLNIAPACALTTGVIWCNEQFRRIAGVGLAWIVSIVPIIYQLATASRGGLPIWIVIAVPVLSICIALFSIRRLLERHETTYRIKFDMPPNWS